MASSKSAGVLAVALGVGLAMAIATGIIGGLFSAALALIVGIIATNEDGVEPGDESDE